MSGVPGMQLSVVAPGRCQLAGELGFSTAASLWPQSATIYAAQRDGRVELDLSGVTHSDSAGLALLVAWQSQARAAGLTLRYSALPDRLMAIARISNVDSWLVG